jgi:hypothetical protein
MATQAVQITPERFAAEAKSLKVVIDGTEIQVEVARDEETGEIRFHYGSLGWWDGRRLKVSVGETLLECQLALSLIVVGSRPNS